MLSTEKNKLLTDKIVVTYRDKEVTIDVYDTQLGKRFIEALKDNLYKQRILEKNFRTLRVGKKPLMEEMHIQNSLSSLILSKHFLL